MSSKPNLEIGMGGGGRNRSATGGRTGHCSLRYAWLAIILLCGVVTGLRAEDNDPNNGEDLTRPLPRFDFRFQYQDKGGGVEQSTFLLRRDQPIPLNERWKISTRFELPLVLSNNSGRDNPDGHMGFGTGDALAQVILIDTLTERFAYGAGARMLFPTANEDQFGSGKYRLIPVAGARYKLTELSRGSYFQLAVRYDFDVGGYGGRNHVSQLQLSPTLNVALPDRWFVTLFPSQDIVLNTIGGKRWFIPADFTVGRNVTDRFVTSLEISVPLVKEFTLYDFKLEARFSYTF